jgi:hypothetical protein
MDGRSLSSRVSTVEWLGWREEEGGTVLIWMPAISPGWCSLGSSYQPELKTGGNYYRMELLGTPFVTVGNTSWDCTGAGYSGLSRKVQ